MNKLYVGNLSYSTTSEKLAEAFGAFGKVMEVVLPTDRQTGRPRGFGFVTMADKESAQAALSLDNSKLDGRNVRVNIAEDRSREGGGGNGGRPTSRGPREGGGFGGERREGGHGGGRDRDHDRHH